MTNWRPCPFCQAELERHEITYPNTSLPVFFHPGTITDNSCVLSGRGFYEDQREMWNRR